MRIGILALQGAFSEHADMMSALGVEVALVRTPAHLDGLWGLVLPGGESTSMRLLAAANGLDQALCDFGAVRPVWGVCAGLILLAACVADETPALGLMDMTVARNAYGRQRDSFVAELAIPSLRDSDRPFPGVFIRAPQLTRTGSGVEVLAVHGGRPVAVRQVNLLATSFHPELTADVRVHEYYLQMCRDACVVA